jgi:hypothetical protein
LAACLTHFKIDVETIEQAKEKGISIVEWKLKKFQCVCVL